MKSTFNFGQKDVIITSVQLTFCVLKMLRSDYTYNSMTSLSYSMWEISQLKQTQHSFTLITYEILLTSTVKYFRLASDRREFDNFT